MSSTIAYGDAIATVTSLQPKAPPRGRRGDGRPFATPAARMEARARGLSLDGLATVSRQDHLRLADVLASAAPAVSAPRHEVAVLSVRLQAPWEQISVLGRAVTHAFVVAWRAAAAADAGANADALLHVRHEPAGSVRTVIADPGSYSAEGLGRRLADQPGDDGQACSLVIHDLTAVPGVMGALGLQGGRAAVTIGAPEPVPVVRLGRSGLHAVAAVAELTVAVRFADSVADETRLAVLAAVTRRFPLGGVGAA